MQAGRKAADRYRKRSAAIIGLVRAHGGYTSFEQLGYELYGRRVGTFIGNLIFSRWVVDILHDGLNDLEEWWSKKKRWMNNNLPYM